MARVKSGTTTKRRHKKVLKMAKGYYGSKRLLYKTAHEQVMKSLVYAYRDRKQNKRNFRKLWIARINAAARLRGMSYSTFMNGLKKAEINLNRKVLSELAIFEPDTFDALVDASKKALEKQGAKKATTAKKTETVKEDSPKKVEASKKTEAVDYSSKSLTELKEIAKEKGISGISKLKKAELIEELNK